MGNRSQQTETSVEYRIARDQQPLVGHDEWGDFPTVIIKSRIACEVSGHRVPIQRLAKTRRDNGLDTAYCLPMAGQSTDIEHGKGSEIPAAARYELDTLGRRTAQTREDGIREAYGHDATGQLTSVDYGTASSLARAASPVVAEAFAYDPVGNRLTATTRQSPVSTHLTTYTANNLNQFTQIARTGPRLSTLDLAPATLSYDANVNLTDDGKQTYRRDSQNRLIAVECAGGGTETVRAEFFYVRA